MYGSDHILRSIIEHSAMKYITTSLLFSILLITSCKTDPDTDPQYQQYVKDTEKAEQEVARRDSTINDLFGTLNRISENLRTIRAKQGQLKQPGRGMEQEADVERTIMADLQSIDSLIEENRKLMDRLRTNAELSTNGLSELQRTIGDMERTIAEKDQEIEMTKEELASTNASMATLIQMYRDQTQRAEMQTEALNTAYYAVGTMRELRANGVLTREGGVAGIGGVSKLDMKGLPKNYFKQIDVLKDLEIPVVARKASLVTPHPEGSYTFKNGAESLVITDPEKFWSISKYLVIVVD